MSESSYDKISEALETTFESKEIVKKEIKEISVSDEDRFKKDFTDVRSNIRELIDTGKEAIDGILKVATDSSRSRKKIIQNENVIDHDDQT